MHPCPSPHTSGCSAPGQVAKWKYNLFNQHSIPSVTQCGLAAAIGGLVGYLKPVILTHHAFAASIDEKLSMQGNSVVPRGVRNSNDRWLAKRQEDGPFHGELTDVTIDVTDNYRPSARDLSFAISSNPVTGLR